MRYLRLSSKPTFSLVDTEQKFGPNRGALKALAAVKLQVTKNKSQTRTESFKRSPIPYPTNMLNNTK